MTLTKLLGNFGFIFCLLGVAGIGGYFDKGTGFIVLTELFIVGIICFHFYIKEGELYEE